MSDKALERATEAAYRAECRRVGMEPADWSNISAHRKEQYRDLVRAAVAAYLDGLLADPPEHVILAGVQRAFDRHIAEPNGIQRENVIGTFQAMVRSLRGSTPGHREGRDDG